MITSFQNAHLWETQLQRLRPGDTFVLPADATYYFMGGMVMYDLRDIEIRVDGVVVFSPYIGAWPRTQATQVMDCMHWVACKNISLTSQARGVIQGMGPHWWGMPGIGYWRQGSNRPHLLRFSHCASVVVEHVVLRNAPKTALWVLHVENLVIRHVMIVARRTGSHRHTLLDWTAYETRGIELRYTRHVQVHDVSVWTQDDAIVVGDGSVDVDIWRVNVSGIAGLSVASSGPSMISGVRVRDSIVMSAHRAVVIGVQSRTLVSNVTVERLTVDRARYPVWIGPDPRTCAYWACDSVEGAVVRDVRIESTLVDASVWLHQGSTIWLQSWTPNVDTLQVHDTFPSLLDADMVDVYITALIVVVVMDLLIVFCISFLRNTQYPPVGH